VTRNPTLQGMAGLAISMTSFGFSKTFSGLVVRYLRDLLPIQLLLIPLIVAASRVY